MKLYEINLLHQTEAGSKDLIKKIAKLADIQEERQPELKRLAYKIQAKTEAFLSSVWIQADQTILAQIKALLKADKQLLRQLILAKADHQLNTPSMKDTIEQNKLKTKQKKQSQTDSLTKQDKISVPLADKKTKTPSKIKATAKKPSADLSTSQPAKKQATKERLKELDKKLEQILKE